MLQYWHLLMLIGLVQQIAAQTVGGSASVPTELFQPVNADTETPSDTQQLQPHPQQQPQPQPQRPQFISNRQQPQTFTYYFPSQNGGGQRNPFLPRPSQIRDRDDSNEFSFENDGNNLGSGTTFYQSSVPNSNTHYWYTSSGSSPELRAQLEAQLKQRLGQVQQQHQHHLTNFRNQGPSSFGSSPGSNGFYREKSYETTYDSSGRAKTTHHEYDSRTGHRTYVTYD